MVQESSLCLAPTWSSIPHLFGPCYRLVTLPLLGSEAHCGQGGCSSWFDGRPAMATWCRMRWAELRVVDHFSPRWAWILQDILGIAFCLYMLKTIRLPTFKVRLPGSMAGSPGWRSEDWVRRRGSRVLGSEPRSSPPLGRWSWHRSWVQPRAFAGLHTAAAGALHLRCLFRLHHPLSDQGRSPLPSQLPAPSPTLANKPVLCRVGTASWWRWPPGPRTHPLTRRYAAPP